MKKRDHEGLWRKRLSAWERSGLSIKEFCDNEHVTEATFYKWRRRLTAGSGTSGASIELVEIGGSEQRTTFELVTAAGVVVRLPPDFSSSTLKRLLDVLDDRG